ncbi:MAG: ABC-F family ATP-binding cassette domain-containing protein [Actinomycetota bacterium]|nr:ABC-F family ATP-binding cassette domain-containing protein [Actinomycetota bacterium]MDA8293093.1 ABC-F family ATP-binding cassette domain-containing protein [Actinomycetota bacterium]
MITASSLTVEIGGRPLVDDASFTIDAGDKVGLVGRNGAGKSTILSVLVGDASSVVRSSGEVRVAGTVGFLPQVPVEGGLGLEPTGFSHVLSARGLDVLDDELRVARDQMAKDPSSENIARFSDLEERFRGQGGYEAEAVMARLAAGLGLDEDLLLEEIDRLSGGQRRRVDLVRALFHQPDVLVLDEPTNHLDRPAKRWLTEELERFRGGILVVSHDLKLLDRSITRVLHLSGGRLKAFAGTYSSYLEQLEADTVRQERLAAHEDAEIARLSALADAMRGSTNRRARTAKSLDRRVDRLAATRTSVTARERASTFRLPAPPRSGTVPVEARQLSVRYGDLVVLAGLDLVVGRGDRVVVVGRNGAGKSSLLRCLAGAQQPSTGRVTVGPNAVVGYFAQDHEQVDADTTVLGNIDDHLLTTETERRRLLGSFGLTGDVANQLPATLSGGERAKLGLAMLAAGRANVLVLDEPTNNLDPPSIEAVGTMLGAWPGTVVAVSHDRAFVEALAPTHCVLLPDEVVTHWDDAYLELVEAR